MAIDFLKPNENHVNGYVLIDDPFNTKNRNVFEEAICISKDNAFEVANFINCNGGFAIGDNTIKFRDVHAWGIGSGNELICELFEAEIDNMIVKHTYAKDDRNDIPPFFEVMSKQKFYATYEGLSQASELAKTAALEILKDIRKDAVNSKATQPINIEDKSTQNIK